MPDSGTPGMEWSWWKATALCLLVSMFPILGHILPWQYVAPVMSVLTVLLTFLFPKLARLLKLIFGRRVYRRIRWLASIVDPDLSVTICESEGPSNMKRRSRAYEDVKAYLGDSCSPKARHLMAETAFYADELEFSMRSGEEVDDEITETEGTPAFTVWWSALTVETREEHGVTRVEGAYRLCYPERHRQHVLHTYLPNVRRKGRDLIHQKIVTNKPGQGWSFHIPFKHPMTFKTLAMDPMRKEEIIDDLNTFKNRGGDYAKVGKPWKRGYLLYGPPGTGKSSMVAAMANLLNYDVCDIELTSVMTNDELRNLLLGRKSKSVIVIEDIDCSADGLTRARKDGDGNDDNGASASVAAANVAQEKKVTSSSRSPATSRRSEVTLSGLLNFIDGLWSACVEEQIFVFTTNHVDMLDDALIRRGRMDKHIEMSYCGFEAFKILADLYLGVKWHPLFGNIEKLLGEVEMTPADVAEHLTLKSEEDNADSCLRDLEAELGSRRTQGMANGARIADAARALPQAAAATEQGPRRSPRINSRVRGTDGVCPN